MIKMLTLVSNNTPERENSESRIFSLVYEEEKKDHEIKMAMSELEQSIKNAHMIIKKVKEQGHTDLEAWVQSKITKSADYLNSVANWLDGRDGLDDKLGTDDDNV